MAAARIDAILYALIKESLRVGEGSEGWYPGGGEEGGAVAAGEGKRSTKRYASNDEAPHWLSNKDMEAVVTHVDKDESGDIDVEVSGFG